MRDGRRILWRIGSFSALAIVLALGTAFSIYRGLVHVNGLAAGKYPVKGIDVSHYQGDIDWQAVAGQEIDFAYIKATEGSSHVDERFAENIAGAREAGMSAGAYHFFSFDSPGASQAENFLKTIRDFQGAMVPAVDVEFYGDKKENPPDAGAVEIQLKDFLDRVEAACGRKPVIYSTWEAWEIYIKGRFAEYPLWIREIWREPDFADGEGWTFWQYTNRGKLHGVWGEEEFVDFNVFFGTRKQWEEWLDGQVMEDANDQASEVLSRSNIW